MNFEVLSGMARSLLSNTETIPKIKNNNAGFVKFSKSKLRFIEYNLNYELHQSQ